MQNLKTTTTSKYLIGAITIISFLSIVCKEKIITTNDDNCNICRDTLENQINPLYPSSVGTYWQYKIYSAGQAGGDDSGWIYNGFNSFNIELKDGTWREDSFSVEIKDKKFICVNDTTYESYGYISYPINSIDSNFIYWAYWNGNDGIYRLGLYNNTYNFFHKGLYIKYPLKKGDKWNDKIVITNGNDFYLFEFINNECLSEMEILSTPAGLLPCYVIFRREKPEDIGGYYDYYEYYSPNIGLVCSVKKYTIPLLSGINGHWEIISVRFLEKYFLTN
ncbi:MAG: hypothetical protein WCT99_05490 [Bacteroidota bacterium]|jgi:hypothetical protein